MWLGQMDMKFLCSILWGGKPISCGKNAALVGTWRTQETRIWTQHAMLELPFQAVPDGQLCHQHCVDGAAAEVCSWALWLLTGTQIPLGMETLE